MRKLDKKDKNYVIVFATIVLVLAVGYAYFAQPLAHRLKTVKENTGSTWWDLWWLDDEEKANDNNDNNNKKIFNPKKYIFSPIFNWKNGDQSNFDKWDIGFIGATKESSTGTATEVAAPTFTKLRATFYVHLTQPGDSITYDYTIKNSGDLDAKVSEIKTTISDDSHNIIFKTSGLEVGDVIKVGQTKHIKVTSLFNPEYDGITVDEKRTIDIIVNYVQNS